MNLHMRIIALIKTIKCIVVLTNETYGSWIFTSKNTYLRQYLDLLHAWDYSENFWYCLISKYGKMSRINVHSPFQQFHNQIGKSHLQVSFDCALLPHYMEN